MQDAVRTEREASSDLMGMIDDGETDWKVFVIRLDDPLAPLLNDVGDLDTQLPGCVNALREWLRVYKVPEGKPINEFALEERAMPREYAMRVSSGTHTRCTAACSRLSGRPSRLVRLST